MERYLVSIKSRVIRIVLVALVSCVSFPLGLFIAVTGGAFLNARQYITEFWQAVRATVRGDDKEVTRMIYATSKSKTQT